VLRTWTRIGGFVRQRTKVLVYALGSEVVFRPWSAPLNEVWPKALARRQSNTFGQAMYDYDKVSCLAGHYPG